MSEYGKKTGVLIRTNGKVEPINVYDLNDMQNAVTPTGHSNGFIEYVLTGGDDITLNGIKQTWDLIGNEEGRLRELPLNPIAREFIAEMCNMPLGNVLSMHGDFLLLGHDDEGATTDCPTHIRERVMQMSMFDAPFASLSTVDADGTHEVYMFGGDEE
jgi:hypothetical protein